MAENDRVRFPFRPSVAEKFAAAGVSLGSDAITLPFNGDQPPVVEDAIALAARQGVELTGSDFEPGVTHLGADDPQPEIEE